MIKEQQELPEGWVWSTLDQISFIGAGNPAPQGDDKFMNGVYPFVRVRDMGALDGSVRLTKVNDYLNESSIGSLKLFKKGAVLFTKSGASTLLNQRAILGQDSFVVSHIAVSEPTEFVCSEWIYYWMKTVDFAIYAHGANMPSMPLSKVKQIKIPITSLGQQKQIVAKIEELFSHIDAGIEGLKKSKALLKQYRQSVLKAAVTGELIGKLFDQEIIHPISKGIESLGQGWSPRCEKKPAVMSEWGVIKTTAVQPLLFLQDENKKLPSNLEPRPHLEVLDGDLLITRAGPRVRVGVCSLVRNPRKKLMICDKVYRARVDCKIVIPEYFELVLNSPQIQDELEQLKTGINDSGVNLTQTKFLKLEMPFPLLEEQKEIVQRVEEKLTNADRLMAELDTKLTQAQQQKQTILASAFKGKLV